MSWGTELWDKFDDVLGHTQKGVDVCEKFSQFTKERCSIELEYANKLKRLSRSYLSKKKEDEELTSSKGFFAMAKEINDIAGQHETISESLQANVWNESQNLMQELKQERKKALQECSKFLGLLQNQFSQLDKAKKNSEKAFREMEKANESYRKTNEDQNMSRNEVEKAKQLFQQKQQAYEQSKQDYAAEVQKTNSVQREHYNTLMPQVFSNLEIMEEKRVAKMKALIVATAEIEKSTLPILNRCIEDMIKGASIVNFQQEKQMVIDCYKTGFVIPSDITFEDISSSVNCKTNIYPSMHGTGSSKKERKRPGLFGILGGGSKEEGIQKDDYSHLPPNQQMRQLTAKTDELKAALAKEMLERDALLKMQDVYRKNSSLGDPKIVAKQLDEKSLQLDQLGQELKKYEEFIAEAGKRPVCKANSANANISQSSTLTSNTSAPQKISQSPVKTRSKPVISHKPSLSQRNSRVEPNSEAPKSINLTPIFPTTPPGASKISMPPSQDSFEDDDEFIDGTICTAIYGYDGSTEGSLAMKAGDELTVVEKDEGDGWVLVRTGKGQQGYVPATYIKYNE